MTDQKTARGEGEFPPRISFFLDKINGLQVTSTMGNGQLEYGVKQHYVSVAEFESALAAKDKRIRELEEALEALSVGHGVPLGAAMAAPPERYRIMAKELNEMLRERTEFARAALASRQGEGEER